MADIKGWTEKTSKSTGKKYYYCASTEKTVWELPADTCAPKAGASAPTAPTAASAASTAKGTLNVTVQTPSGAKSFTVTAKGGKYRKTRKNKKNKSRKNKNKQRK